MKSVGFCVWSLLIVALSTSAAMAQTPPDYRGIIRKNLLQVAVADAPKKKDEPITISAVNGSKPMFPKLSEVGMLEISSSARDVVSNVGRAWLVCLRVDAAQRPQDYAVFLVDGAIADYRANVLSDRCGAQAYEPFSVALPKEDPPEGRAAKSGPPKRAQAQKRSADATASDETLASTKR